MKLIPAIDIRAGKGVRLYKGDFSQETIYSDDPVELAARWQRDGASLLHIVDLDGARDGTSGNREIISTICRSLEIPVQVGGGLRSIADIEEAFGAGASRVVVGTMALEDPEMLEEALRRWGANVTVALDARNGVLTTRGWLGDSGQGVISTAEQMVSWGVKCLIYTDIARDGTLEGPNLEGIKTLQQALGSGVEVIASGGIANLDDLIRLRDAGVSGAIIGKALYTGSIELAEALRQVGEQSQRVG
ncbi:MAG: 1-(5-phosphoribosyl)-5-[(5-phosphoribosylamino)methylideneamino]imidazole-4-carboxamide isomerase [Chloroflexia bacterium]